MMMMRNEIHGGLPDGFADDGADPYASRWNPPVTADLGHVAGATYCFPAQSNGASDHLQRQWLYKTSYPRRWPSSKLISPRSSPTCSSPRGTARGCEPPISSRGRRGVKMNPKTVGEIERSVASCATPLPPKATTNTEEVIAA